MIISHHLTTNSLFLSSSFNFAIKSSWFKSLAGSFFKQCLWYLFQAHSSQIWTLLSTKNLIFESHLRNQRSSTIIHLWKTFFVVKRGNPLLKSKRICLQKTDLIKGGVSHFSSYWAKTSGEKYSPLYLLVNQDIEIQDVFP